MFAWAENTPEQLKNHDTHKRRRPVTKFMPLIEKGIAVAIPTQNTSNQVKLVMNDMEVGDSFSVPKDQIRGVVSSLITWFNQNGKKFQSKKISEDHFRVWRTE